MDMLLTSVGVDRDKVVAGGRLVGARDPALAGVTADEVVVAPEGSGGLRARHVGVCVRREGS